MNLQAGITHNVPDRWCGRELPCGRKMQGHMSNFRTMIVLFYTDLETAVKLEKLLIRKLRDLIADGEYIADVLNKSKGGEAPKRYGNASYFLYCAWGHPMVS